MNGAQHYIAAEKLLATGDEDNILKALVHSNLAHAAAVAERTVHYPNGAVSRHAGAQDAWNATFESPELAAV